MLDLHRLRLLAIFAERGSIAATAAASGYSASAVSQQLAALEREAGAQLLDRTARSAELTLAGRRLAAHAERILAAVERAEADLAAEAAEPAGRVTVAAIPTAAVAFAPALTRALAGHQRLQLVVRQAGRDDGLRLLRAGEADIAIVDDWSDEPLEDPSGLLAFTHLTDDPLVLAVPRRHRLADGKTPVRFAALRDEHWIAAPPTEPSRAALDALLAGADTPGLIAWEFEGLHSILALVGHGLGIAVVPRLALAMGISGVVARDLPGPRRRRRVYAAARASSAQWPAVGATMSALRAAATGRSDRPRIEP